MAIVTVNVSLLGAATAGGKQATVVSRGSGQSGTVTVQVDTTKITSRNQCLALIAEALSTIRELS